MRRAVWLICALTALLLGAGVCVDTLQTRAAERYLRAAEDVRAQVLADDLDAAWQEQRYLHALWQHDEDWLNLVVSHHHTRAVNTAFTRLDTALAEAARLEALQALDELTDALTDVAESDAPRLENVL